MIGWGSCTWFKSVLDDFPLDHPADMTLSPTSVKWGNNGDLPGGCEVSQTPPPTVSTTQQTSD